MTAWEKEILIKIQDEIDLQNKYECSVSAGIRKLIKQEIKKAVTEVDWKYSDDMPYSENVEINKDEVLKSRGIDNG